jgi:hypothetical protein
MIHLQMGTKLKLVDFCAPTAQDQRGLLVQNRFVAHQRRIPDIVSSLFLSSVQYG